LLVIGDSTAAGVGVESQLDGLPGNLARTISSRLERGVEWTVIARSGATTGNIREFFLGLATRTDFDLVFLSTGVNDVMQLRHSREFTNDLEEIVERLGKTNPRAPILLAGIPRMQRFASLPDPLGTILGARAHRLNVAARHRVVEHHQRVVHVPPWPISTAGFFAIDNFHPGAPGYAAWAERSVDFWIRSMT
jgi:lysophospholipase L1-like esterase